MLYDLIQKLKGKETLMMTDTLPKVKARQRSFVTSQKGKIRGNRVEYVIRDSFDEARYFKKPNRIAISGSDPRNARPSRVK